VVDLLLKKLLYNTYRGNAMGRDASDAFDKPVPPPDSLKPMKAASDALSLARGVPSYTYLKYAYQSPWAIELPPPIEGGEISCSSLVLRNLVAEPLSDHTKVAEVLSLGVGDLVDAATIVSLRFAGGALHGSLTA
jgi:hypothetical protein